MQGVGRTIGAVVRQIRRLERSTRVSRKYRDVVALGRVQMDLSGIDRGLLVARTANAIAAVADHVRARDRLSRFAGQCPDAASGHNWHVAGVEVRSESGNNSSCRRAARRRWIRGALRINEESTVLLDDPPIIRDCGGFVLAVDKIHGKIGRRREVDGDGSGTRAHRTL